MKELRELTDDAALQYTLSFLRILNFFLLTVILLVQIRCCFIDD